MQKLRWLGLMLVAAGILVACGNSPALTGSGTGGSAGNPYSNQGAGGSTASPGGGNTLGTGNSTAGSSAAGSSAAGTGGSKCGDGVRQTGEQCEPTDLAGMKCSTLGYASGTLSCDKTACTFDTSMCVGTAGGGAGSGSAGTGH